LHFVIYDIEIFLPDYQGVTNKFQTFLQLHPNKWKRLFTFAPMNNIQIALPEIPEWFQELHPYSPEEQEVKYVEDEEENTIITKVLRSGAFSNINTDENKSGFYYQAFSSGEFGTEMIEMTPVEAQTLMMKITHIQEEKERDYKKHQIDVYKKWVKAFKTMLQ